jgi:hypothetical protein
VSNEEMDVIHGRVVEILASWIAATILATVDKGVIAQ